LKGEEVSGNFAQTFNTQQTRLLASLRPISQKKIHINTCESCAAGMMVHMALEGIVVGRAEVMVISR
jgi:hypothetical protein